MELRQLRYLLAIVQEGSFTQAAEKVYVSQSALSQQIQALEQEVGTVLLDRSKRGVRLTAAGELLCHHTRRILHELEQARVAIEELEGLKRGELRAGVVQTVNTYLVPSIVNAFTAAYPEIRLSIEELSSDDIERGLEQGDLQVGLSFIPPASGLLQAEALFEEQLALIVRDDHPLAGEGRVAVRELHEMPMIMLANTFCTRRLWEESARLASARPRVMIEMNTVSSILAAVLKTGLPTILPKLAPLEERSQHLVCLDLHSPTPSRQVGLLWHQEHFLCASSRAFIAITRDVAAGFVSLAV